MIITMLSIVYTLNFEDMNNDIIFLGFMAQLFFAIILSIGYGIILLLILSEKNNHKDLEVQE